jgi:hypothetical protein
MSAIASDAQADIERHEQQARSLSEHREGSTLPHIVLHEQRLILAAQPAWAEQARQGIEESVRA